MSRPAVGQSAAQPPAPDPTENQQPAESTESAQDQQSPPPESSEGQN